MHVALKALESSLSVIALTVHLFCRVQGTLSLSLPQALKVTISRRLPDGADSLESVSTDSSGYNSIS